MLPNVSQSYPGLPLCRQFNGASGLQAAMDRLGLVAFAPVATAVVQGLLQQYKNGNVGEQAAMDRLGLIAFAPVATAVVQGLLQHYENGNVGECMVDAR